MDEVQVLGAIGGAISTLASQQAETDGALERVKLDQLAGFNPEKARLTFESGTMGTIRVGVYNPITKVTKWMTDFF